jgi:hypothetical protein
MGPILHLNASPSLYRLLYSAVQYDAGLQYNTSTIHYIEIHAFSFHLQFSTSFYIKNKHYITLKFGTMVAQTLMSLKWQHLSH